MLLYKFYPLILIAQAFCIYHAYKNGTDQKWYWIIVFLPVIGSVIYLYDHFYNRENISQISEGVKEAVNSNYKVEKLKRQVNFTDSVENKMNLADTYMEQDDYEGALELYESCLEGFNRNNHNLHQRLIQCYFFLGKFEKAIIFGNKIENVREFQKSEAKIAYAWSYYETGNYENAARLFESMNTRYSNYPHRMEYSKFLKLTGKSELGLDILDDLDREYDQMNSAERKHIRGINRQIDQLRKSF